MGAEVKLLLVVVLALAAGAASAQVTRCVDPVTKRVTYTDGLCASGQSSQVIARKSTHEEQAQQELDALRARLRFHRETLQADLSRLDDKQQRAATGAGPVGMSGGGSNCSSARRNVEVQDSSVTRRGVPHGALDAMDAACGTYTPRVAREFAEIDRAREARRAYAPIR